MKYFSISEAAQELGVSISTLRRWEREGKISVGRTPGGQRLFTKEDLDLLASPIKTKIGKSKISFTLPSFKVPPKGLVLTSLLLIAIVSNLYLLSLTPIPRQAVLGVETFVAPAVEEISPLLFPVTRFISGLGNSLRLRASAFLIALLQNPVEQTTFSLPEGIKVEGNNIFLGSSFEGLTTVNNNFEVLGSSVVQSLQVQGPLDVQGPTTLGSLSTNTITTTSSSSIGGNLTLTGTINGDTLTSTKLVFSGSSPSIYPTTTNTGISFNGNGTGAINIGNSGTGDVYIAGGSGDGGCTVTNSSGTLNCSGNITSAGDLIANGGDILTDQSTLRIGSSSTTVNIGGTLKVGTSTTTITGSTVSSGQLSLSRVPTLAHTGTWAIGSTTWNESDATIYVNPASATADSNIFALSVGGSVKFDVDAEGDLYANNVILAGSVTSATTTVGTLNVEGDTSLGDATTDTLTIKPSTITINGASGTETLDLTGAATQTLSILNSTGGQVANLLVEGTVQSSNISANATVSGTNTGDQTITLTGDVTGSGTGSFATTLANSGVTAGSYGGATAVPVLTIDAKGRITAASTASISSSWSSLTDPTTNLALTMGANTSTFTYNAATSTANLFNLTDTTNNTGTGYLMNITTAAGSTLKPFHVQTTGSIDAITVIANGETGIGTAAPGAQLQINPSATTTIGEIIKAQANQSADLLQIQDSLANVMAKVDSLGNLTANTLTSTVATGTAPLTVASTTVVANLNAAAAQEPMPNLVLNSDFGRRNKWMTFMPEVFSDTSGWTSASSLSVTSNILTIVTANKWAKGAMGAFVWRDGRWSAQFKITSTTGAFYFAKYVDAGDNFLSGNAVYVSWVAGNLHLYKDIGGALTEIGTSTAVAGTLNNWYWLELEAQGSTYIAKIYNSGASPVAKSSATLLATTSGTAADAGVVAGGIAMQSDQANSQWGGLSTGDGGVYVEGWGPESWTPTFDGTLGGQAIGFDETADSGPLNKQVAMRVYIPPAANFRRVFFKQIGPDGSLESNTYTSSIYLKVSGTTAAGLMKSSIVEMNSAQTEGAEHVITDNNEAAWTPKAITWTAAATARRPESFISINYLGTANAGGTFYFLLPQLEKGGIQTPWRNAPADDGPLQPVIATFQKDGTNIVLSDSVSELESSRLAINLFCPWDCGIEVIGNGIANSSDASSQIDIDATLDGTQIQGIARFAPGTVSQTFAYIARVAASAGKHRIALRGKRAAGAGTVQIFAGAFDVSPRLSITATRGKFDLAEEYTVLDQSIESGDVVRISNIKNQISNSTGDFNNIYHYSGLTTVEKSDKGYDGSVLGIVSTAPGITLGSTVELNSYQNKPNLRPVALSGRVPVKVTNENGVIKRGDTLTSSEKYPGYAMRATKAGRSIGVAMENFSCQSLEPSISNLQAPSSNTCTGKVLTFVNLSWYDPDVYLADNGQFVIAKNESTQTTSTGSENQLAQLDENGQIVQNTTPDTSLYNKLVYYTLKNSATNETVERTGAFNNLFVANLKVGSLDVSQTNLDSRIQSLEVRLKNLELATGSAVLSASVSGLLNEQTATNSGILSSLTVSGRTLLNDLGITGKVTAGLLSIDGLGGSINSLGELRLQDQQIAGINILNGKILIDKNGNIKVQKISVDESNSLTASIGEGVISTGSFSVTVQTTSVSTSSRIFVTPVSATDKPLIVGNIVDGKSFDVIIVSPYSADIKFNWWIIN